MDSMLSDRRGWSGPGHAAAGQLALSVPLLDAPAATMQRCRTLSFPLLMGRTPFDAGRPRGSGIPQRAADRRADGHQSVFSAFEDAGQQWLDTACRIHPVGVLR